MVNSKKRLPAALRFLLPFAAISLLNGCATLFTGTSQKVQFDSSPPGAEVVVNGVVSGVTPTTVELHRDGETIVTFRKTDYDPQAVPLPTKIEPSFWLNIVLLSPIGVAVDLGDRADLTFSQESYVVTLQPRDVGSASSTQREQEVRDYIGVNYKALGQETGKLKGEHLEQLIDLLYITADERPDARRILQDVYYLSHSESAFADAVVKKFGLTTS